MRSARPKTIVSEYSSITLQKNVGTLKIMVLVMTWNSHQRKDMCIGNLVEMVVYFIPYLLCTCARM